VTLETPRAASGKDSSTRFGLITTLVRVIIGAACLAAVLWSTDLEGLGRRLGSIRGGVAVMLLLTAVAGRVLMAGKWNLLLRSRGVLISTWQATRLYLIGHLLGSFTPGALGADVYRVTALRRFGRTREIVATVLLERFVGLAVVGIVTALGLPVSARYLGADSTRMVSVIVISVSLMVVGVWASLSPSLVEGLARKVPFVSRLGVVGKIRDFYRSYAESRIHGGTLAAFTALTVLEVLVTVLVVYLAGRSVGVDAPLGYLLCIVPLIQILLRLPVSFQGIGVQEGLYAFFLAKVGFSPSDGLSISLMLRLTEIVGIVLPASLLLWKGPALLSPPVSRVE